MVSKQHEIRDGLLSKSLGNTYNYVTNYYIGKKSTQTRDSRISY